MLKRQNQAHVTSPEVFGDLLAVATVPLDQIIVLDLRLVQERELLAIGDQ